jgi:hypothetical protein
MMIMAATKMKPLAMGETYRSRMPMRAATPVANRVATHSYCHRDRHDPRSLRALANRRSGFSDVTDRAWMAVNRRTGSTLLYRRTVLRGFANLTGPTLLFRRTILRRLTDLTRSALLYLRAGLHYGTRSVDRRASLALVLHVLLLVPILFLDLPLVRILLLFLFFFLALLLLLFSQGGVHFFRQLSVLFFLFLSFLPHGRAVLQKEGKDHNDAENTNFPHGGCEQTDCSKLELAGGFSPCSSQIS